MADSRVRNLAEALLPHDKELKSSLSESSFRSGNRSPYIGLHQARISEPQGLGEPSLG